MADYDVIVIGAGIVGLATARQLQIAAPKWRVAVLEKESGPAEHQSGRNSGVIHSGIYYRPGSAKARQCLEGVEKLTRYCKEKKIAYRRSGKVIVATDEDELPRLRELKKRGEANGVKGLQMIGPEQLRELEPAAYGLQALWSPYTSVVDFKEVADHLKKDILDNGGKIFFNAEVWSLRRMNDEIVVSAKEDQYTSRFVVNCAGLHADRVFQLADGKKPPCRIIPFRGEYYTLTPAAAERIHGLIYPVPDPAFPFLGVHFTKMIHGTVEAGPNAVLAFSREGYRRCSFNMMDLYDCLRFRGFWTLARRHWKMGLSEMWRSYSKKAFLHSLQRLVPDLTAEDIVPGSSGVRAQVVMKDGSLIDDFLIEKTPRCLHVLNAPSPAATASLAIGDHLSSLILKDFT